MAITPTKICKTLFEVESPTNTYSNFLSKLTDTKARKTIKTCQESESPSTKRGYDTAFTPDVSDANNRIAKILFPSSPSSSPTQFCRNRPTVRQTPPPFFLNAPVVQEMQIEMPLTYHNNLKTQESKPVPLRPTKRARAGSIVSPFQKQHEALCNGTFKYKVTYLAKGSFSNCYTLEGNVERIIPGVNNSDLVLTAFHGENTGFVETKLRAQLRNKIANYHAAENNKLPVAPIYNADTAEQDGYILQQKISGKIDPMNGDHRIQVGCYVDTSVKKRIIFDFQEQNFGLENNQVLLRDFIEDPDDDDELDAFNKKVIEEWLNIYQKNGVPKDQIAIFLNELSANHYKDFIQERLG